MYRAKLDKIWAQIRQGAFVIHPSYQRQGIGKTLFHHIKNEFIRQGHKKFYLDAGFSSSQQYWEHILGKPRLY
ncbi:N-acetyltransferase [Siminovitchia terrae]|uniref:N-acetyltransferase n=1 Tax=Siminovitchia terrae TaxID=1914933 RepID=A0A429XAA7_SIMTE|nr:N-acetyltransferase [Siminovitchia terrae]